MRNEYGFEVIALTGGPKHHFFGYYDIQTWDSTGKYVLALESDFDDRFPTAGDTATVGMVEWETRTFHPLTRTHAWNLQQGCMLHWPPTEPDRKIIYNDRDGDHFVSVVMDVFSGDKRMLSRPVAGSPTTAARRSRSTTRACASAAGWSVTPGWTIPTSTYRTRTTTACSWWTWRPVTASCWSPLRRPSS